MIVLPQKSSFAVNDTLCISCLVSSWKVISSSAMIVQGRNLPLMLIHVCSNGLGPAAVTAVGGRLIDGWGVNVFLVFAAACAAAGLLVVITATSRHFEKEDSKG